MIITLDLIEEKIGRLPREIIWMESAKMWSRRSTCKRLKVGAVITDSELRNSWIGYNGPAKGLPADRCRNQEGNCGCLHAERNACNQCDGNIKNKIMFVTVSPCEMCAQDIIQNNISTVYYIDDYRSFTGRLLLDKVGIRVIKWQDYIKGLIKNFDGFSFDNKDKGEVSHD